jgi:hypothetical protein
MLHGVVVFGRLAVIELHPMRTVSLLARNVGILL